MKIADRLTAIEVKVRMIEKIGYVLLALIAGQLGIDLAV